MVIPSSLPPGSTAPPPPPTPHLHLGNIVTIIFTPAASPCPSLLAMHGKGLR